MKEKMANLIRIAVPLMLIFDAAINGLSSRAMTLIRRPISASLWLN